MRLRDILSAKSKGNAHADHELLDAIDAYVMNPRTPEEGKLKALAKLDEVMGLPSPANAKYALRVYMATKAEHFVEGPANETNVTH